MGDGLENLLGKWKVDRDENFSAYLEASGTSFMLRKVASNSKPTIILTKNADGSVTVKTEIAMISRESVLQLGGHEFEMKDPDQNLVQATAVMQDGKLITTTIPKEAKQKKHKVIREIVGDEMVMTMEMNDGEVKCKRILKKVS